MTDVLGYLGPVLSGIVPAPEHSHFCDFCRDLVTGGFHEVCTSQPIGNHVLMALDLAEDGLVIHGKGHH